MADEALTYLASLPKPSLIAELDYEAINAERYEVLTALQWLVRLNATAKAA